MSLRRNGVENTSVRLATTGTGGGASRRLKARLVKEGWDTTQGFKFKPGFILVQTRSISARVNQNYDGWPAEELKKAAHTFVGKPVFVNHTNENPAEARGVVVASRYVDAGNDKYIETIMEIDAQRFPKLAHEIRTGGLDSVSMGAEAQFTICSACGNRATDLSDMCDHVLNHKGEIIRVRNRHTGKLEDRLIFERCYKLSFFELSFVFDPADETAVASKVLVANKRYADCPPGDVGCETNSQLSDTVKAIPVGTSSPSKSPGTSSPSGTSGTPSPSGVPSDGGGIPLIQKPDGTWTSSDPAWAHLIDRESGGRNIIQSPSTQDVNSGGNEAFGIFQITPETWKSHGGEGNVYESTPQQQAEVAADIFRSNPSGSDWGAGLSGREDPGALAKAVQPSDIQTANRHTASFEDQVLRAAGFTAGKYTKDDFAINDGKKPWEREEEEDTVKEARTSFEDQVLKYAWGKTESPAKRKLAWGTQDYQGYKIKTKRVKKDGFPATEVHVNGHYHWTYPDHEGGPENAVEMTKRYVDDSIKRPDAYEWSRDRSFESRVLKAWGETEAPQKVDTLREEGSADEDDSDDFHHYVESPKELRTPDLDQAAQIDRQQQDEGPQQQAPGGSCGCDDQGRYMTLKIPIPQAQQQQQIPMQAFGNRRTSADVSNYDNISYVDPNGPVGPTPVNPTPGNVSGGDAGNVIADPSLQLPATGPLDPANNTQGNIGNAGIGKGPDVRVGTSTLDYLDNYFGRKVADWRDAIEAGREFTPEEHADYRRQASTMENASAVSTTNRSSTEKGMSNMSTRNSTLAQRGKTASRNRRKHFAEGPLADGGDQSRNDQGEQEEVFISQTPPEVPVEMPTDDTPNISNTEGNLVEALRRSTAQTQALAMKLNQHRRYAQDDPGLGGDYGYGTGTFTEGKDIPHALIGGGNPSDVPTGNTGTFTTTGGRRRTAEEVATVVNPTVSDPASEELTGDNFESANPNDGVVDTSPHEASLYAFRAFDNWLRQTTGQTSRNLKSATIRRAADDYAKRAGIPVQALFPALGIVLRQARKNEAATQRAAKRTGSPKKGTMRRQADEKLEVAAPDARTDVEAPVRGTTDAEAQASQFDASDFGQNAGDNISDADLSTDQNWPPGEGKSAGRKPAKADGILAVQCAEAYINAGLEPPERKYQLAGMFQNMARGTVQRDIALLERVAMLHAHQRKVAAGRTRGATQSPIPAGLMTGSMARTASQRVAAHDPINDSLLFN